MVRFFVAPEDLEREKVSLIGENAQHAKVLRLKPGETVLLCDGEGREAVCEVASTDGWLLHRMKRREPQSEAAIKVSACSRVVTPRLRRAARYGSTASSPRPAACA